MTIAVCIHMFYTDMWGDIKSYLTNLEQPYNLYVSVVVGYYDETFLDTLKAFKSDVIISVVENRGVDIGGFFNSYLKTQNEELILKIHTKKSIGLDNKPSDMVRVYGLESAKQKGLEWFHRNMEGVLGSKEKIEKIIKSFNDENIGMIGHNLETYVGPNEFLVKELMSMFKLSKDVYGSNFIDGTMFWVRNDIFKKYLTEDMINYLLKIIPKGYFNEPGLNHSLERILGYIVKNEGKDIIVCR